MPDCYVIDLDEWELPWWAVHRRKWWRRARRHLRNGIRANLYWFGFLRFVVSWKLLWWINQRTETCWSGMVMWKMGYGWSWAVRESCFRGWPLGDYCGRFDSHPLCDRVIQEARAEGDMRALACNLPPDFWDRPVKPLDDMPALWRGAIDAPR